MSELFRNREPFSERVIWQQRDEFVSVVSECSAGFTRSPRRQHPASVPLKFTVIMGGVATSKARWWESNLNLGFAGTVVAGLAIAAILGVFGPVWWWLISAWRWVVHPVPVPLVVFVAMVGALVVFALGLLRKMQEPPLPPWLDYREDRFLEVIWRWRYRSDDQLAEASLTPYCPRCETGLRLQPQSYAAVGTCFICDECSFRQDVPGSVDEVFERVARLIEREANRRVRAPAR